MVAVAVATKAKELPVDYTRYAIIMQAVISLYVASQAPQSVSRDLRFKTVPLYFSRPIETADYVRAKFAALASALFILTGVLAYRSRSWREVPSSCRPTAPRFDFVTSSSVRFLKRRRRRRSRPSQNK